MTTAPAAGGDGGRRLPWWQDLGVTIPILSVLYTVSYIAWYAIEANGSPLRHVLARLVFLPLNAATVVLAWRASRKPSAHPRTRRALRLVTAAYASVLVGNIVSFYVGMEMGGDPGASWINILYFPFYPLVLLALLTFPLARREQHERRKFLLDTAAVLLGGGIAIWYLVVRPTTLANHLTPLGSAIALAYPLSDLLLFVGLATLLLRWPAGGRSAARTVFIAGLITYTLCDLVNDLVFLQLGWFGLSWTDLTYLVTYCVLIAGLGGFTWPNPTDDPAEGDAGLHVHGFSPLPYAALALDYGIVLVAAARSWPAPLSVLAVGAAAVTALVVARQLTAVRENARLLADRAARENEARFRALVQHSSDVTAIVDEAGVFRFVSPSVTRILGYEPAELIGRRVSEILDARGAASAVALLASASRAPGATGREEWNVRHRDGRWLQVETVGTNLLSEPTVCGIVLNTRDISERKRLEEQLTHQAFHDPLTGLANRQLFLDRVSHALSLGRRHEQMLAVLFVDLDGFKTINDSLGHAAGDTLLVSMGRRLQACVRDSDTVARLGGDEFAMLIEEATDRDMATVVAERIAAAVRHPIQVEGKEVFITASVGIATSKGDDTASDLLRNADMAMYVAKSRGKSRYECFEPGMHAKALERLEMQAELRRALERGGEFTLHYQPIVQLQTGEVTGIEALVRWMHPQRGLIGPPQFIPLAEETGLIVPLGRWVLREACSQAQRWQQRRPAGPPLTLTVNVSGHQLQFEGVVEDVRNALRDSGLDPRQLVLEITESVLMQKNETILERFRALKALGVRLAIDDFGTGYSSLGYLQRFPIDILKIDKAFVDDIGSTGAEPALVRAIIALGDTLRLQTIAEGIELTQQLRGLQELGCEMGQGYLFARPVGVAQMEQLFSGGVSGGSAAFPRASTPGITAQTG